MEFQKKQDTIGQLKAAKKKIDTIINNLNQLHNDITHVEYLKDKTRNDSIVIKQSAIYIGNKELVGSYTLRTDIRNMVVAFLEHRLVQYKKEFDDECRVAEQLGFSCKPEDSVLSDEDGTT